MPHKRAKRSIREEQRSQKGADLAPRSGGGGGDPLSNEPLPKSFLRALNAEQVRADFRAKRKRQRDDGDSNREYEGGGKEKRRKLGEKGEGKNGNGETKIRPGETLAHFNKRIESDMRPLVRSAVQASLATTRAERKKALSSTASAASSSTPTPSASSSANAKSKPHQKQADADAEGALQIPEDKHAHRPKEFARTSSAAPRRLNDIALAPPDLSAMARRANAKSTNTTGAMMNGAASKGKDGKKAPSTKASSILSPAQALQMAAAREDAVRRYREMKAARWAAGGGGDGERGGGAVGEGEGE